MSFRRLAYELMTTYLFRGTISDSMPYPYNDDPTRKLYLGNCEFSTTSDTSVIAGKSYYLEISSPNVSHHIPLVSVSGDPNGLGLKEATGTYDWLVSSTETGYSPVDVYHCPPNKNTSGNISKHAPGTFITEQYLVEVIDPVGSPKAEGWYTLTGVTSPSGNPLDSKWYEYEEDDNKYVPSRDTQKVSDKAYYIASPSSATFVTQGITYYQPQFIIKNVTEIIFADALTNWGEISCIKIQDTSANELFYGQLDTEGGDYLVIDSETSTALATAGNTPKALGLYEQDSITHVYSKTTDTQWDSEKTYYGRSFPFVKQDYRPKFKEGSIQITLSSEDVQS